MKRLSAIGACSLATIGPLAGSVPVGRGSGQLGRGRGATGVREFHGTPVWLKQRNRGRGRGSREPQAGDWTCACGSVNGFSRRECFKCQAPAPPLPLGESRPRLPGEDPHDWACPCGKMNFRGAVNCYKCSMPKPLPPRAPDAPAMMWKCGRCKFISRASKKPFCSRCGALREKTGSDVEDAPPSMPADPYGASVGATPVVGGY